MRLPFSNFAAAMAAVLTICIGLTITDTQPPGAQTSSPPAQTAGPPPPKNLQFFPKDTPRPEVIAIMRQFSFALGVRCEYCHIDEDNGGREDFASDEKPAKVKARAMLQMTKQINDDLLARIPDRSHPPVVVGCVTCHHGLARPQSLTDRLRAAAAAGGADSAVAELKHLRDIAEFGNFDVSEWGVTEAARNLAGEKKTKEALALLNANAGFHPNSMAIPAALAEFHAADGDTSGAIEILEKLMAKDPENRRAKQMLERLRGPGKKGNP